MSFGSAARATDDYYDVNETPRTIPAPVAEQARYEPRFRVVTRKSLAPRRRPLINPLHRALFVGAVPALFLLVYVMFWTLAMRGGYYKAQLQSRIKETMVVQAELRAEKRRLQSPGPIMLRAQSELGMVPAGERQFVRVGAASAVPAVPEDTP
ncbi:MAG TPA: hypothetical protein VFU47_12275 [Armatimonadota bacterium]|nr:hypothetical protein [Armatimonadota bacterium]